ncbi:MAG: MltA domain-containing protein [Phycisphaerales bacterium]|nr:MltA domain-containing protein [Phycisphaerales bacterium]
MTSPGTGPKGLSSPLRVVMALILSGLAGCSTAPEAKPRYDAPLPPGSVVLRPVPPGQEPDLGAAWEDRSTGLGEAVTRSISWYGYPSSTRRFPYRTSNGEITHAEAVASLARFQELLAECQTAEEFKARFLREFQVYQSVGWNGKGIVLFTGYYTPDFQASLQPTEGFRHPIYKRPEDLVTDERDGIPIGQRRPDGSIGAYPTRREIESSNMLAGDELAWMESALDAYVVQVNGSARLNLPDGGIIHVGYAGKTERPYRGLGREAVKEGLIAPEELSLPAIYRLHERDPKTVQELIHRNESYVFFQEYDGANWPAGSLGVKVTPKRSLATGKSVYPPGALCLVKTQGVDVSGTRTPFYQFMLDQDTGGAIQAPGRADIYMGEGDDAETLAGGQYAEGTLYYFFLK